MYTTPIEILAKSQTRDEYNELNDELKPVALCFAQTTESGGRENMYASRIVHENEIVFTIRYRDSLKAGMFVKYQGQLLKIESIHTEGRRYRLHLKCNKSDAQD